MKLKQGDKVKFLNEKGGGIVTQILGPNMVKIEIENGFEIPVLSNELIKVETFANGTAEKAFDNLKKDNSSDRSSVKKEINESESQSKNDFNENNYEDNTDDRITSIYKNNSKSIPNGIFLAFVPQDQKWTLTKGIDIFLINNTDYDILYTFNLSDDMLFDGVDYGSVTMFSKAFINSISFEEIELWSRGLVQVLFQKETDNKILTPLSVEFDIKPTKFHKEGNYTLFPLLNLKAFTYTLSELNSVTHLNNNLKINKEIEVEPEPEPVKAKVSKIETLISKHILKNNEAVVDLHLDALFDDANDIDSADMLNLQINYFEKALESAISEKLYKVTFIHGIGEGKLKSAIIAKLKDYIGKVYYEPAPAKDFGHGAINIFILKKGNI